ncbi:MAG: response regulator [Pseudomonadota bacterium]|nr:response regulator [Pseudomonadota bacterium]
MARILLVEDNDDNWDMLSRRLERRGYQVERAMDGQMALDKASAETFDLILMDVNLPGMDGLEATRRIRALDRRPRPPIIALSAHALATDQEKAAEAGVDGYHTKPVELPLLLEQMEGLLNAPSS